MAGIKLSEGSRVQVRNDGRIGVVSGVSPIKDGSRGRPKTSVAVTLETGVEQYGIKDLKVI